MAGELKQPQISNNVAIDDLQIVHNGQVFEPSEPAAIVFAVLYGLICICTIAQYIYYKCWFWIFAVLASLSEFCLGDGTVVTTLADIEQWKLLVM
jgi:hypothetical protein